MQNAQLENLAVYTILCVEILTLRRGHFSRYAILQLENLAVYTILTGQLVTSIGSVYYSPCGDIDTPQKTTKQPCILFSC